MKILIGLMLGILVYLLLNYGPEPFQYHTYRIYKEIKELKERVSKLEDE